MRVPPLGRLDDRGGERGDVHRGLGQGLQNRAQHVRIDDRQVALQVDDDVVASLGIVALDGLMHAVGAGGEPGVGHHRPPAGALDRLGDRRIGAGDDDRPEAGLHGAAPDVHDHRLAGDLGQRLVGQPRGGEPGGDDDDGMHGRRHRSPSCWGGCSLAARRRAANRRIGGGRY